LEAVARAATVAAAGTVDLPGPSSISPRAAGRRVGRALRRDRVAAVLEGARRASAPRVPASTGSPAPMALSVRAGRAAMAPMSSPAPGAAGAAATTAAGAAAAALSVPPRGSSALPAVVVAGQA